MSDTPRHAIARELAEIHIFPDGDEWDVAGLILNGLTDEHVRYLARARMIELCDDTEDDGT